MLRADHAMITKRQADAAIKAFDAEARREPSPAEMKELRTMIDKAQVNKSGLYGTGARRYLAGVVRRRACMAAAIKAANAQTSSEI